jgi:hypothetical protein
MLHLLSKHSLGKEGPAKERQLALAISKEREEDFLIPLRMEALANSDLPWQLTDINLIGFENWANGLKQLLKKLSDAGYPKPILKEGMYIAANSFLLSEAIVDAEKILKSNCLPFDTIPEAINRYRLSRPLLKVEEMELSDLWAFHKIDDETLLAFTRPPRHDLPRLKISQAGSASWKDVPDIDGIRPRDVVTTLLKKSLICKGVELGLVHEKESEILFFPRGLLEKDRLRFMSYRGRKTHFTVVGSVKFGNGRAHYRLGLAISVRRDVIHGFVALTKVRIHIVAENGEPVSPKRSLPRRKKIVKSWWNHHWLSRQMAIWSYLAQGTERITIGREKREQIVLLSSPVTGEVPFSVNEEYLRPVKATIGALNMAESDDEVLAEVDEDEP